MATDIVIAPGSIGLGMAQSLLSAGYKVYGCGIGRQRIATLAEKDAVRQSPTAPDWLRDQGFPARFNR